MNTWRRKYTGFKFPHFNYLFVFCFIFYFFYFFISFSFSSFSEDKWFLFNIRYLLWKSENGKWLWILFSIYTEKMQTISCCREEIKIFMQISRPSYWNIRTSQSFAVQRNNSTRIRKITTCGTKGLWIRQVFSLVFS